MPDLGGGIDAVAAKAIAEFDPNKDNSSFFSQEFGESGSSTGSGGADLLDNIGKQILAEIKKTASAIGWEPIVAEQLFEQFEGDFWRSAQEDIFQYNALISPTLLEAGVIEGSNDLVGGGGPADEFLENPQSVNLLLNYARYWWGTKLGPDFADNWRASGSGSSGRSGGGGPSEADIRAQFDLNQLAIRADDLYRAYLLTDADAPRSLAKAYVDQVVKNPKQQLDFDTFILTNYVQKSPRYASIYKNKPKSMSEIDFLSPYMNTAKQVLRPDEAANVAIGGAQFGADAAAFEERLKRSNEFRTSSPFLQSLEGRMRSLQGVLKG